MTKLRACAHCQAFVPLALDACAHCGAAAPRSKPALRGLLALGGGSLLSLTLSACYGAPVDPEPVDSGTPPTGMCTDSSADTDGDGYCLDFDCDESDPLIHADALDDVGDGVDQNCDGADGVVSADAGT